MSSDKQSETAMAPRQQSDALALLAGGRPETAKALAKAINECHAVSKDARNQHHGYNYASADAIIEVGRKALSDAGLILLPLEASLDGSSREGPDRFELTRTFILLCGSEMTPLRVCWPVCPEKGRPLDKATAIADTLSLSYLLRDLLLMNRVDPSDDVNARDDRQQPQRQQAMPAKTPKPPPQDGAELVRRLRAAEAKMVELGRCKADELFEYVRHQGALLGQPTNFVQWSADVLRLTSGWVTTFKAAHPAPAQVNGTPQTESGKPVTPAMAKDLQNLMGKKRVPWTGPLGMCRHLKLAETTMIEDLTTAQYQQAVQTCNEVPG